MGAGSPFSLCNKKNPKIFIELNMFLIHIKSKHFKFSPYLTLIVPLVPEKIIHSVLVPTQFKFV